MKLNCVHRLISVLPLSFCLLIQPGWADDAVMVKSESAGVSIYASDVLADAARIPDESRAFILSQPDNVAKLANNLFVRRMLAADAEAAGLDRDPAVAAALRVARDRVLADARIAQVEAAARPDAASVERLARIEYTANPDRFKAEERIRARHILIARSAERARDTAAEVLAEARAQGADFAALAGKYSNDPGSAARGGDLGWFARGRMVKPFEEAAFALEPGSISDVVETEFGFHIIRLEERKPAGMQSFEEVRDEVMKSVEARLLTQARGVETRRIQEAARPDADAIRGLSALHQ